MIKAEDIYFRRCLSPNIIYTIYYFEGPCTTEVKYDDEGQALKANTCVFPFKYKGVTYNKCTTVDSDNNKSWCAYDIQPNTEVPQDGKHWGDCNYDCPGGGLSYIYNI